MPGLSQQDPRMGKGRYHTTEFSVVLSEVQAGTVNQCQTISNDAFVREPDAKTQRRIDAEPTNE